MPAQERSGIPATVGIQSKETSYRMPVPGLLPAGASSTGMTNDLLKQSFSIGDCISAERFESAFPLENPPSSPFGKGGWGDLVRAATGATVIHRLLSRGRLRKGQWRAGRQEPTDDVASQKFHALNTNNDVGIDCRHAAVWMRE